MARTVLRYMIRVELDMDVSHPEEGETIRELLEEIRTIGTAEIEDTSLVQIENEKR